MTIHDQLIELGFKLTMNGGYTTQYKKRNVEVSVVDMGSYDSTYSLHVEVAKRNHYTIEMWKHYIKPTDTDFAIKLLQRFIKKEVGK